MGDPEREFRVRVLIEPKPDLLDPQGQAVERALRELGLPAWQTRMGKLVRFVLAASSPREARARAAEAGKLLANPVIEDFAVEVEEP